MGVRIAARPIENWRSSMLEKSVGADSPRQWSRPARTHWHARLPPWRYRGGPGGIGSLASMMIPLMIIPWGLGSPT
jgi:hypothetical protein